MNKQDKTPWDVPYSKAFVEATEQQLLQTAIATAGKKAGLDDKTAGLMGRLEILNLISVGAMAHEANQNSATLALQLHNDINLRTSFLGREIGRLWQAMPAPSLGTTLFNSVAGSTIGQRLGLSPLVPAQPAEFDPVPKSANRHKSDQTPPVLSSLLATITGGGGSIALADPEPKAVDAAFVVSILFGAGSSAAVGDTVAKVTFGTPYDKIPVVNFSLSGTFAPSPFVVTNVSKTGFDIRCNSGVGGSLTFAMSITTAPSFGDSTF